MKSSRTVFIAFLVTVGLAVNERSSGQDAATKEVISQPNKSWPDLQEYISPRRKEIASKAYLQQRERIRWGKCVNGLQMGIAGPDEGQCIPISSTVRFTLFIRNVGDNPVRFKYVWPKMCFFIAPRIFTAEGKVVPLTQTHFRGGHKEFVETLPPEEVTMVWLEGTVGIGEKGRATNASPFIAKPVHGKYSLSGWLRPYLIDDRGAAKGKPFVLESGSIRFLIVDAGDIGLKSGTE